MSLLKVICGYLFFGLHPAAPPDAQAQHAAHETTHAQDTHDEYDDEDLDDEIDDFLGETYRYGLGIKI